MARRKSKKISKSGILAIFVLVIIIAIFLSIIYFYYPETWNKIFYPNDNIVEPSDETGGGSGTGGSGVSGTTSIGENLTISQGSNLTFGQGECSVHFLELGNGRAGDCILIKVDNTEVLIDAGSYSNSIETISAYIDTYCTDGILEYVIVTHADTDHIACFAGTTGASYLTIFDRYDCRTIIDFPLTNSTTATYNRYLAERDAEVAKGAVRYSALDCYNNVNGASRTYTLGDGVTLEILYNYYYEHKSDDENNYSVCCLLTDGDYKYLLTGDLEEEGEAYLVQYNNLPEVDVYKGGHHGSYSSSTDTLLSVIKPKVVIFMCVMGSYQYTSDINNVFPALTPCQTISKYTDKIFAPRWYDESVETDKIYNGNIVIIGKSTELSIVCSGYTTSITESTWYQTCRAPYITES